MADIEVKRNEEEKVWLARFTDAKGGLVIRGNGTLTVTEEFKITDYRVPLLYAEAVSVLKKDGQLPPSPITLESITLKNLIAAAQDTPLNSTDNLSTPTPVLIIGDQSLEKDNARPMKVLIGKAIGFENRRLILQKPLKILYSWVYPGRQFPLSVQELTGSDRNIGATLLTPQSYRIRDISRFKEITKIAESLLRA